MFIMHKQMACGCIVGVTLLGLVAGCSLKEAPVPRPPVPQAHEEATPTPAPQAKEEATPAGPPETTQVVTASWYGPGFDGKETASGATFDQHAMTAGHPSDAAARDGGQSDQSGNRPIGPGDD